MSEANPDHEGTDDLEEVEELDDDERLQRLLERCVMTLSEHFDSVRIFVTHGQREGNRPVTSGKSAGCGNIYATYGWVREWMLNQEHLTRLEVEKRNRDSDI